MLKATDQSVAEPGPGSRGFLLPRPGLWQLSWPSWLQTSGGESPRRNPQSPTLWKDEVIRLAFQGSIRTKNPLCFCNSRLAESERPLEAINAPLQFGVEMGNMRLRGVRPHGDIVGDLDFSDHIGQDFSTTLFCLCSLVKEFLPSQSR